jgi:hypothetical protein
MNADCTLNEMLGGSTVASLFGVSMGNRCRITHSRPNEGKPIHSLHVPLYQMFPSKQAVNLNIQNVNGRE